MVTSNGSDDLIYQRRQKEKNRAVLIPNGKRKAATLKKIRVPVPNGSARIMRSQTSALAI